MSEQQTKLASFTEAAVNTVLAYITAMITQVIFYPVFNIHISISDQLLLALLFTLVSLLRNYFVRRVFNNHYKAMLEWLNGFFGYWFDGNKPKYNPDKGLVLSFNLTKDKLSMFKELSEVEAVYKVRYTRSCKVEATRNYDGSCNVRVYF